MSEKDDARDEAALAAALGAASYDNEPLTAAMEDKLLASYRKSRARVGASTTGAGTQTLDVDELVETSSLRVLRPRPSRARFVALAAAAIVILGVGAAFVQTGARPTAAGGREATVSWVSHGVLRVDVPDRTAPLWFHVAREGGDVVLGPVVLAADGTVPSEISGALRGGERLRVSRSRSGEGIVLDAVVPGEPTK